MTAARSQCDAIAEFLKRPGAKFTALEALSLFACLRPAARVADLRRRGIPVKTQMIPVPDGKRVAEYSLEVA